MISAPSQLAIIATRLDARERRISCHINDYAHERRCFSPALGERIARSVQRALEVGAGGVTTVGVVGGRIQLIITVVARCVRIVALCPQSLRQRVTAALSHARYVLAAVTQKNDVDTRTGRRCAKCASRCDDDLRVIVKKEEAVSRYDVDTSTGITYTHPYLHLADGADSRARTTAIVAGVA